MKIEANYALAWLRVRSADMIGDIFNLDMYDIYASDASRGVASRLLKCPNLA